MQGPLRGRLDQYSGFFDTVIQSGVTCPGLGSTAIYGQDGVGLPGDSGYVDGCHQKTFVFSSDFFAGRCRLKPVIQRNRQRENHHDHDSDSKWILGGHYSSDP